jgi:hypothetical protein|tara:strand:+ start:6674 stop:6922 length:249 start_codon:yes stop_codon:yes gene_type:complete
MMNYGGNSLMQPARQWAPSMRMSPRLGGAYGHHCGGFREMAGYMKNQRTFLVLLAFCLTVAPQILFSIHDLFTETVFFKDIK